MSEIQSDNGNGRVTLAILSTKLDDVLRRLKDIDDNQRSHDHLISQILQAEVKHEQQIDALRGDVDEQCEDIEALKASDKAWGVFNSALTIVASAIVALLKGAQ